jgi:hypothetical protein
MIATPSVTHWPAVEEKSFLVNCNATSGGQLPRCRCELLWLERRFTYGKIATIYLHDQTRLRAILLRGLAACQ